MSVLELNFRNISYKPGWEFHLLENNTLLISYPADDPVSGAQVQVKAHWSQKEPWTNGQIFRRIMQLEEHEAGEWFDESGNRPFNPHKETA